MNLPIPLIGNETCSPASCEGSASSVTIYGAPPELLKLPLSGTMLIRFNRKRVAVSGPSSVEVSFGISEILEVKAEETDDVDSPEDILDQLFHEAQETEAEEKAEHATGEEDAD